jgi:hypothetical protein
VNRTLGIRIGLLGLTLLTGAIGLAQAIALPSYLSVWPDSDRVIPILFVVVPLAAAAAFGFALVRFQSARPIIPAVVGAVLLACGLFGLLPIIEFQTFPFKHDWATVVSNYGDVADMVAGILAIVEAAIWWTPTGKPRTPPALRRPGLQ